MRITSYRFSSEVFALLKNRLRAWVPGALAYLMATAAQAQAVPKAIVVEHFTNTLCSVCAGRNPGFYANLRQQPGVLHIAYHPSSPYRACVFSQQNASENDARTNIYGVYGSTPRLVLNGNAVPAAQDYAAPALFAPYQGHTSPFAVAVALRPTGPDSITATVRLATRAAHAYAGLTLYVALVQDTVFYAAPNGEQRHYDVFRKSFTEVNALALVPATAVGGVVTVTKTVYKNPTWTATRLYATAIVQDAAQQVVQAAASAHFASVLSATRGAAAGGPALVIYPNPVTSRLLLRGENAALRNLTVLIYNGLGRLVRRQAVANAGEGIGVSELPTGTYWLRTMPSADGRYLSGRFMKVDQ